MRLPSTFREGLSTPVYVYQLTPVGAPMPGLHVAQEVLWGGERGEEVGGELRRRAVVGERGGGYGFVVRGGGGEWVGVVDGELCGGG